MNPPTWSQVFAAQAVLRRLCWCLLVLASLLPSTVRCAQSSPSLYTSGGSYVSVYDHLDVGRLLRNEKLVSAYVKCFVGEGACTAEGRLVKAGLLPEIIRTVCSRCSPRQKNMARQVLKHVYYTRRSDFERIMVIYDNEGRSYNAIIDFMNQNQ